MDLFEDIKNLSEARDLLAMIQNDPQTICEQYWIEMDDMYAVEEEVTARINAIEEKDIKKFCEYKLAKKSVDWIMRATKTEKLETSLNNLSYRKSESVSILDEALIPEEYRKEKVTKTIDKVSIKDAIKSGKDVAGASIEEKQNLQIK